MPTTSTSAVVRADLSRPARPHDTSRSPPCCCTPSPCALPFRHRPAPAGAARPVRAHPQCRRTGAHRSPDVVLDPQQRWYRRLYADPFVDVWLISWAVEQLHRAARPRGLAGCADRRRRGAQEQRWVPAGAGPAHPQAAGRARARLRAGPCARRRQQRAAARRQRARLLSAADRDVVLRRGRGGRPAADPDRAHHRRLCLMGRWAMTTVGIDRLLARPAPPDRVPRQAAPTGGRGRPVGRHPPGRRSGSARAVSLRRW